MIVLQVGDKGGYFPGVSTRIHKQIETEYAVRQTATCAAAAIAIPTECFAAVPTQIGGAGNNGVGN